MSKAKAINRNIYYVKETLLEFVFSNRKYFLISFVSFLIGFSLGLCVGVRNASNFTFINISDKTIIAIFSGGSFINFLLKNVLKYLFFALLIMVINNFPMLSFLSYIFFAYLSFCLIINSIIFVHILGLKGFLFVIFYFLLTLVNLALLVVIFVMCRQQCLCCGNSSKFSCYPYKAIVIACIAMIISCLLLSLISLLFKNFIIIIV